MLARNYFRMLNARWGPNNVDVIASNDNNPCARFFSLHRCRETAGIDTFGQDWAWESCRSNGPYSLVGKVWRSLREQKGVATMLIPLWEFAPWWQLLCPVSGHLSDYGRTLQHMGEQLCLRNGGLW